MDKVRTGVFLVALIFMVIPFFVGYKPSLFWIPFILLSGLFLFSDRKKEVKT